jgi:hypothetical protein
MNNPWIANAYHKKKAGIIFAKKALTNEEMDKIFEEYIQLEKQNLERRLRDSDGCLIHYTWG